MRKILVCWMAILLVLSSFAQVPVLANSAEASNLELETSRTLLSLTEARTVEVQADFGERVDLDELQFQFGGKNLSDWKKWSGGTNYNGAPFITVVEEPHFVDDTTVVKATLQFDLPFDTTNLSNRTIRIQYQQLIGNYELALINTVSGQKAATNVKLNVYDEFLFYEEIKPAIDEVFAQAEANDRYLKYEVAGQSVEGRDIHFVTLAKDESAVNKYLNETLPTALDDPSSLLEKIENGTIGDYQIPIWINNIHPDEVEGVDAQVELLREFALEEEITFTTQDPTTKEETEVTLNVDEVLDDVIFLYLFTSNPDGRVANTRANANGFDLNRDNAYQTQVETQQVNELIAKWTPLSFIDMHGYVNGFLIEPTTPPHNPNFEYDLLHGNMINQAHAMGQAGIGNSNLDSYFIPKLEWEDGWDDMTPAYTAVFSMLHGSLGHTIEVPELGQDSYRAMFGAGLGATLFVTENKDELYANQLRVFERGVNGEDNRAVDQYYVNAAGETIGRVRGEHENFFPDYYVIPTDTKEQKNLSEAEKMVDYLIRNGVKVEKTTKSVHLNGTKYPKGTYVVPMNQAKRGLANAVLYKGEDVSDWAAMYDPIVVNFPDLRGFTIHEVREKGVFSNVTNSVDEVNFTTGKIVGNTPKQVLKNTNNDTVKLVNELLKDGKTVEVALETNARVNKGDFIVETKDLRSYANDYYFEAISLGNSKNIKTNVLVQPKVSVTGSSQLSYTLKELGFDLVSQADADVIVSDNTSFNRNNIEGKAYIGLGVSALSAVRLSGILPGYDFGYTRTSHEGLVKANVNDHLLTSGYGNDELLYVTTGAWISSVPDGAEVLATFSNAEDFYVAGWWPGHEGANGETLAFTTDVDGTSITLFANSLAFRAHTDHSYRLLANSIYASVGEENEKKKRGNAKGHANTVNDVNVKVEGEKVTATVAEKALLSKKNDANLFTIQVDRPTTDGSVVVQLPANDIKQLQKSQPNAKVEIQTETSTFVIALTDIDLKKLGKINGKGYINVTFSVEKQDNGGKAEELSEVELVNVNID
ncbi:M14 family metallopeptidase [Sutcliffiella sp. NC1]|uniref:M14 family metallopeptidase n=1 Tax=Sutcliffiella sp. NC1 TaxID=3004096 RepID=UPI0022DE4BC1|nr:M14 family zinc carboxypeptidase [Sutcliffiella sp. NC1]WBL14583.1 M14 family zinc carboxypeptidase [Sutcliffiella sp. NC1]